MAEGARDDVYDVLMRPNMNSKIKLFKPKVRVVTPVTPSGRNLSV